MLHSITLDALRALDAIDRQGSFAAAASTLHKVPSALTYTIKKLEDDIGSPLFDRSQHRARLTPAGKLVLEQGREILKATERMIELLQRLETGWETHLRITRDTVIPSLPVLTTLNAFCQLGQPTDITLSVEALGGCWDALHSHRSDIVVGAVGELPKGLFKTIRMAEINPIFVVARDHPLALVDGELSAADLEPYPAIVIADSSQLLPARSSGLLNRRNVIRVSSAEEKIQAQVAGLGVGFIPRHLIREPLARGDLVIKDCYLPRSPQTVYLAWRSGQEGKALAWFIDALARLDWQRILDG